MAIDKKVRATAVDIDELLGQSERRHRAYAHGEDVLEAAALIREMRKRANLSQKELAHRIGTDQSYVSELERGNGPQGPTFAMLKRIARACDDPVVVFRKKELSSLRRELEKAQKRRDELEREVFLLRAPAHRPIVNSEVRNIRGNVRRPVSGGTGRDSVRISNTAVVTKSSKGTNLTIRYHLDPDRFNFTGNTMKGLLDKIEEKRNEWARMNEEFVNVAEGLVQTLERRVKTDTSIKEKASSRPPHDELALRVAAIDLFASTLELLINKDEQR